MNHQLTIEPGVDVLEANRAIARDNYTLLLKNAVKSYDFMGAIGSGKTLLIERLVEILKTNGRRAAAIAGDVAGDEDYKRFIKLGIPAVNVNTGKECHLSAHLIEHALEKLTLQEIDVLFIENVGNLVCPGDFPLGTDMRVVVVSVSEGDDMIKKHPVIFGLADAIVINKIDLAKMVDVDPQVLVEDAKKVNPTAPVLLTDAKHSKGINELAAALKLL